MKRIHLSVFSAALVCGGLQAQSFVLNPANGHYYEAVAIPTGVTWDSASLMASSKGGYLATITSDAENQFVFQLINNDQYWSGTSGPWIGAYQPNGSSEPTGGWKWLNEEGLLASGFTSWAPEEPNDDRSYDERGELYLHFSVPPGQSRSAIWNDLGNYNNWLGQPDTVAFVIEYSTVPEPSTYGLVCGLAALGFAVGRKLKNQRGSDNC